MHKQRNGWQGLSLQTIAPVISKGPLPWIISWRARSFGTDAFLLPSGAINASHEQAATVPLSKFAISSTSTGWKVVRNLCAAQNYLIIWLSLHRHRVNKEATTVVVTKGEPPVAEATVDSRSRVLTGENECNWYKFVPANASKVRKWQTCFWKRYCKLLNFIALNACCCYYCLYNYKSN